MKKIIALSFLLGLFLSGATFADHATMAHEYIELPTDMEWTDSGC